MIFPLTHSPGQCRARRKRPAKSDASANPINRAVRIILVDVIECETLTTSPAFCLAMLTIRSFGPERRAIVFVALPTACCILDRKNRFFEDLMCRCGEQQVIGSRA